MTLTTTVETTPIAPATCHIGDNIVCSANASLGDRVWIFGRNITIEDRVIIGSYVHIVGDNITIEEGAVIEDFVTIGPDTVVGAGALIESRSDIRNVAIDPGMTLPGNACYHMAAQIDALRYQN